MTAARPWIEREDLDAHLAGVNADAACRMLAHDLRRDGLAVFDLSPASLAVIDRVAADAEPLFTPGVRRVQDLWRRSAAVRALAGDARLTRALETVYGRRPFAFQTLNFRQGSEQHTHVDTMHFHSAPAGWMCGVWIALEDIRPEAGPLVYFPGSHRLPYPDEPEAQAAGLSADDYQQRLVRQLHERGLPAAHVMPKKGQAVIWAANLAHGGAPITDPGATRRSLVIHYFFHGTAFDTPLASGFDPARRRWRLPSDVVSGRPVWPRIDGRRAPVAPRTLALWALRAATRKVHRLD